MKNKFESIARILILISFFHFSGINNGFTAIITFTSVGTFHQNNFTTVLVQKISFALNPFRWKNILSSSGWIHLFQKSKRIVECANRCLLANILVASNLNNDIALLANQSQSSSPTFETDVRTDLDQMAQLQGTELKNNIMFDILSTAMDDPYKNSWINKEELNLKNIRKPATELTDKLTLKKCFEQSAKLKANEKRYLKSSDCESNLMWQKVAGDYSEDDEDGEDEPTFAQSTDLLQKNHSDT